MEEKSVDNKKYLKWIYVVSVLIPIVVAILIFFPAKLGISGDWIYFLPTFHAIVNSLTVLVLVAALIAIKKKEIEVHKKLMFTGLILGVFFLLSYVIYHSNVESVKFGDINSDGFVSEYEKANIGNTRTVYLSILASHILLSIGVVPFVLFAFYYALSNQIDKHRRIVKFTYPIWLYVSITGVIVYLMIKPYY